MKKSIKQTGLIYTNPVKKLEQGGLTMGYGYRDPNKDMYRNIGDSNIFKNAIKPVSDTFSRSHNQSMFTQRNVQAANKHVANFGKLQEGAPAKVDISKTIKNPKNTSMGSGLLYSKDGYNVDSGEANTKVPDVTQQPPPAEAPPIENFQLTGSGAVSAAGTANSIAQPALALLNDKDPTTYTKHEQAGTINSSVIGGSAMGLSTAVALGATVGSVYPIVGTVIGAAVGLGYGLWNASKKTKEAKKASNQKNLSIERKETAGRKKRLAGKDANIASSAGTTFGTTSGQLNSKNGTPGGYLSSLR